MEKTYLDSSIYKQCMQHYDQVKGHNHVVKNSIPIPFFGDIEEYFRSDIKVVTAALNPSDIEFPDDIARFNIEQSLGGPLGLENSLKNYFRFNPYTRWFKSFEPVLNGLGASYGAKMLSNEMGLCSYSTALHLDVCSPIATRPTWSKLSKKQKETLTDCGKSIFEKVVCNLKPDVIIASVSWSHLSDWNKEFSAGINWPILVEYDTNKHGEAIKLPIKVQSKVIALDNDHEFLFVNGSAANTPFGHFSNLRKKEVGLAINNKLNSIKKN